MGIYSSSEDAERAMAPARSLQLVAKSDGDQATQFRGLRVAVQNADAPATLKVTAIDDTGGAGDVTLNFPAAGVYWEPIQVKRVYTTGSTANAVVHGIPV
ncbi:hypothetical protein ACVWW6_005529 [Bradyrhizobium sp. USDA 3311]